jgi:hypothetical protein
MNREDRLRKVLLEEGLEDLISLPEAADTCRAEGLLEGDDELSLSPVMEALLDLFRAERIQVWAGRPIDNEELVGNTEVETLLREPARYRWASDLDQQRRVYYVNTENLRVDPRP